MANPLVILKVKIGTNEKGAAKYPDFNSIPSNIRGNMDWSSYIDSFGSGWIYDSVGHKEEVINGDEFDSPLGNQWGMILVPSAFASSAESLFPNEVKVIEEVVAKDFYDNRVAAKQPEHLVDIKALEAIKVREDLGEDVSLLKQKSLDPNDKTPGLSVNKNKTWEGFKENKNITIDKKP